MADKVNKSKNANKSTLPAQASAQDTSNWDDKAFTTPQTKKGYARDVIYHDLKREKSMLIPQPKDWKPDTNPKKNNSKD